MWEYLTPCWERSAGSPRQRDVPNQVEAPGNSRHPPDHLPGIDRTAKLFIDGRQTRPDQGYSLAVRGSQGLPVGEVGRGTRKDVRNAVEAAHRAAGWATASAHQRAQVLYYLAENLAERNAEFASRICALTGCTEAQAARELQATIERIFLYAGWADKWDGAIHQTPFRNVTLALPEPLGVLGVVCPDEPALLGFLSSVLPAVALGNCVVALPSQRFPLLATDCYQVFETSDVPAGVINIITGLRSELVETLAAHDDVDGLWYFPDDSGSAQVERASAGNLKRTWVSCGRARDWYDPAQGAGAEFLRHATQVKNIWIPYGE
jgi:aldehyde dehydrogenase (NAD+)